MEAESGLLRTWNCWRRHLIGMPRSLRTLPAHSQRIPSLRKRMVLASNRCLMSLRRTSFFLPADPSIAHVVTDSAAHSLVILPSHTW